MGLTPPGDELPISRLRGLRSTDLGTMSGWERNNDPTMAKRIQQPASWYDFRYCQDLKSQQQKQNKNEFNNNIVYLDFMP